MKIEYGISSLLFLIPIFYAPNYIIKTNIFLLTCASFLNNSTMNNKFKFIDHFFIYTTSVSYINNYTINVLLLTVGLTELYMMNHIVYSKNIAYTTRSLYYFYIHYNSNINFEIFIVIIGIITFKLKSHIKYNFNINSNYYLLLTTLWHSIISYELCCY